MSPDFVIKLASDAVYVILKISLPIVLATLVIGLLVSILQATTQIQEQTLAFVPKIIAALVAILIFGPWILTTMVDYAFNLLVNLHQYIG